MFDLMTHFFLAFSQSSMILLIVLIGFFFINRAIFFQAACLVNFNIVVNVVLKGIFKVPLALSLHKIGYAFPSGHMQLTTVFYVWLALYLTSNYWRGFVLVLLFGMGVSLIHFGYHNINEVAAGLVIGLLLVGLCHFGLQEWEAYFSKALIGTASGLMICNKLLYGVIPIYTWMAYLTLLGLIIIEEMATKVWDKKSYWAHPGRVKSNEA